jgi:16S rRNA C967 or C1407 C5-methylase (RsmB/RsmF family)
MNASNKYISKYGKKNQWNMDDFEERFLDGKKMENILKLQKLLILNGYRLLKKNGIMIYSTCSFSE